MQVVGGGESGFSDSDVGVLTGGVEVGKTVVMTITWSKGTTGALVGWDSGSTGGGPESDPVVCCNSVGVGVGVKVGVDVGMGVGLLVGLCVGRTGGFTTVLQGVSVAVGVTVGGTSLTVKSIALFATTVSIPSILAITSALIEYLGSPPVGQDPDILKLITIRLPSLTGVIDLLLGQPLPWQLCVSVNTESFLYTQAFRAKPVALEL